MTDEMLKILEMVAAGTLTPEQGNELIDALGDGDGRREDQEQHDAVQVGRWQRQGNPTLKKLAEARMHGVTPEFIASMQSIGFPDLSLDDLIKLRIHGVSPSLVQELRAAGYDITGVQDAVELSITGVTGEYIREMARLGFGVPVTNVAGEREPESEER